MPLGIYGCYVVLYTHYNSLHPIKQENIAALVGTHSRFFRKKKGLS